MIDYCKRSSLGLFGSGNATNYFPDKWKLISSAGGGLALKGTVSSVPPTAKALSQEVNIGPQDIILAVGAH